MTDEALKIPQLPMAYQGKGWFQVASRPLTALCERAIGKGEILQFVRAKKRSRKSHNQFFWVVDNAWHNLRERSALTTLFTSGEHLRKYLLIKVGWCDTDTLILASPEEALAVGMVLRKRDHFSIISVVENVIVVMTAKTQKENPADEPREFEEVKDRVCHLLAEMLGTDPVALAKAEAA